MKAVLVIDMPNRCSECPCYSLNAQAKRFECDAKLTLKGEIGVVELDKKPHWCPLKPLPKKEELADEVVELGSYNEGYENGYECGYANGRNDCIDEIMGEPE